MPGDPARSRDIRIRHATARDAAAIGRIYVETWRATYAGTLPDKVLVRMSARGQQRQWAAAIAGRDRVVVAERPVRGGPVPVRGQLRGVIGFGSAGRCRDPGLGYAGEVYTLYVRPDDQNQGIGRRLLQGLFDELRASGHDSALVWVVSTNPSRFFYERIGGVRVAERNERLWGTEVRQIAYGWSSLRPPRGEL